MKILLINPPFLSFSGIKNSGGNIMPLNLAYLAAYLIKHNPNCEVKILDTEVLRMTYNSILKELKKEKQDIIGISCTTPSMNHVKIIAEFSKKANPKCYTVVGGIHPTALPEETINTPNIDVVIIGEGERTLSEFVYAIQNHKSFKKIKGIVYKSKKKVIFTKPREFIKNLDSLPFPARDLLNLKLYKSTATKRISEGESTPILSGRGCPYNCIHCVSKLIWKQKVRLRSQKNFVDEIEECVEKYKIKDFNFIDDTFTLYEERVISICREICRRKLDICWICFSRVNHISKKMLVEMKKAGCRKISLGLESGSQKVLDGMRKKITIEMGIKAVDLINNIGINVHASFMLGNIGETEETIKETIEFAKSLNIDNTTFFVTSPYPGTDLYKIAKQRGYINSHTKWEDFAPFTDTLAIPIQETITPEELSEWQKRAFRQFYLRPKYIYNKIRKIKSINDIKVIIEGLKIFIRLNRKKEKE